MATLTGIHGYRETSENPTLQANGKGDGGNRLPHPSKGIS